VSIFPAKILLAADGSKEAQLAARSAVYMAEKTGSELHMIHVFGIAPVGPPVYPNVTEFEGVEQEEAEAVQLQRISEQRARKDLDDDVKKVRSVGGKVEEAHLREGRVAPEIIALAEEIDAGLIVMGSRGRGGIRRALMGSVSDSVVRHAHCPVLVVRWKALVSPARILLATDGSEVATLAAQTAADIVKKTGSDLHVVYVMPTLVDVLDANRDELLPFGPRTNEIEDIILGEAWEFLKAQAEPISAAGDTVQQDHLHLKTGRPDSDIVELADKEIHAELIILGNRGAGGVKRALMGSVSDSVVRHAHCPVLVVRKKGDVAEHKGQST
jgi:nucleotide-binding universal stress UspA family protein